ncbi:MAG: alpha/beta fold hydrolase, partial [Stellaceae bacterium]
EEVVGRKFPVGRDQQSGHPLPQDPDVQNPANRARLLALDPRGFARQMAYWEAYFTTSADLAIAGCRLIDREWDSIKAPTIVIGGVDPIHPSNAGERLRRLLPNAELHPPVVTLEEWGGLFGKVPYPQVADFQGSRIAPVWRDFLRKVERREIWQGGSS